MSIPTFDSNKKDPLFSYLTQVKMFDRRHGLEKALSEEQPDEDVMADGVNTCGLEARFGYMMFKENMKT